MDRLPVGGGGHGNTEVAPHAAAAAVLAGRQVAPAARTTMLARQHLETTRDGSRRSTRRWRSGRARRLGRGGAG